MKKKIGLITNWYPTEENPYQGLFFKEQAIAMQDYFEFIIIHYTEKRKTPTLIYWLRRLIDKSFSILEERKEQNTVEYSVYVFFPGYMLITDKIFDLYQKHVKHSAEEGIGVFVSKAYQKRKKELLTKIAYTEYFNDLDVFYAIDAQNESFTLQCLAEALNKPYVVAEHAPFPWPGTCLRDAEKRAMEQADLFMAISYDKIRQILLQNVKLGKIAYVGNMVNEEQFTMCDSCNKEKTFIIVAANSFYKNYDLFIEIFERLVTITEIPFRVMIVGYGANKGYSKNTKELEEKLLKSKFSNCIELIPEVDHDEIQNYYQKADAFVMTSIQEGMPVSALEAACCGLPIFSTMCGGVEDYVNEKVGRIYKIVDSESFAHGLKDYLEGKIIFDRKYIRKYIIEQFGKEMFVERMAQVFYDVISK